LRRLFVFFGASMSAMGIYRQLPHDSPLHLSWCPCRIRDSRVSEFEHKEFFPMHLGTGSIAFVDYNFIVGTVSRLRAELDHIGIENRLYFARKGHREDEIRKHQDRKDRVMEIKLELERLMTRKVA
jgi:hypothetical protein